MIFSKNGTISFTEFIKAVSIPAKGTIEEKLDCKALKLLRVELYLKV
jgi:hypothetical protein